VFRVALLPSQLEAALRAQAREVVRASELGHGAAMLLVVELADRHVVYAPRLFRAHAAPVMALHRDGRIVFAHADTIRVDARLAIDVHGDAVRFENGDQRTRVTLARVSSDVRTALVERLRDLAARAFSS
jgi:hypothetical protein